MNVAIDSSIYRQASDYAQSRGLNINPGSVMGAAIGASDDAACGDITIKSTVTHVTATKGLYAEASIGAANDEDSQCGEVNIEDESKVTQN